MAIKVGTPFNDTLAGIAGDDTLQGLDGNDLLTDYPGGNDLLEGGLGDDYLSGGGGVDTLLGGEGNDRLDGSSGADYMDGGAGDDYLSSSNSPYNESDVVLGGEGNDTFSGDAALVDMGSGDDLLYIYGNDAAVDAGSGDDKIWVGDTAVITTGAGRDAVILRDFYRSIPEGFVYPKIPIRITDFTAGDGGDTLDFTAMLERAVGYDESNPFATGYLHLAQSGPDTLIQWDLDGAGGRGSAVTLIRLSNVKVSSLSTANFGFSPDGSTGPARAIAGSELGEVLSGGAGSDTIQGLAGDDSLNGAFGSDSLDGAAGADSIFGGFGHDTLLGGAGNDLLDGESGDDWLSGGEGDDILNDSLGANTMLAGAGNDRLSGTAALVDAGDGNDVISIFGDGAVIDAGAGDDTISVRDTSVITTGTGRDVVAPQLLEGIIDGLLIFDTDTFRIADFSVGEGGDMLRLLDNAIRSRTYLRITQDGADTLIGWISNTYPNLGSFNPLIRLENVDAVSLNNSTNLEVVLTFLPPESSVIGTSGNDSLSGTSGSDTMRGGAGRDLIDGKDGNDLLNGGADGDTLLGGAGNDILSGTAGNDILDGGDGRDWLDLSAATAAVAVDLGRTAAQTLVADQGRDAVLGIENVLGGAFDDSLVGASGENTLSGGGGDDLLFGQDGADTLSGDAGADTLDGGLGADVLAGGAGNDTYIVDSMRDTVMEFTVSEVVGFEADTGGLDLVKASRSFALSAYVEDLTLTGRAVNGRGNELNNVITGNDVANLIRGREGNDTLIGGRGADTLEGGVGDDTFVGLDAGDRLDGGPGVDTLSMAAVKSRSWIYLDGTDEKGVAHSNAYAAAGVVLASVENIVGSASGSDAFWGDAGVNVLTGLGGNDRLYGKGGNDRLEGGDGNDTLSGGAGTDALTGGTGMDQFVLDVAPATGSVEWIIDFEAGVDKMVISRSAFGIGAGITPALIAGAAPVASGQGGVLLYDNAGGGAGGLFWDEDGAGGAGPVQIAHLSRGAALTESDFLLVA
ncbi:calcium-binding protein [Roseomonas populi]|uniref:Calcium-binding protein n=1 Tax=Roseomonas populi TaxID=3121582 RepID=A0ABT1XCY4_9PROT|nr:calcium-binding protein [Roseomonas pecuniae]MCR0985293.1 calcium-binding protein [Roseomonas pecuniae]